MANLYRPSGKPKSRQWTLVAGNINHPNVEKSVQAKCDGTIDLLRTMTDIDLGSQDHCNPPAGCLNSTQACPFSFACPSMAQLCHVTASRSQTLSAAHSAPDTASQSSGLTKRQITLASQRTSHLLLPRLMRQAHRTNQQGSAVCHRAGRLS